MSIEQIINVYYKNGAQKLYAVVDEIFCREYGGAANRDMDDFYGIATDVFVEIIKNDTYDPQKGDFEGYFYNALKLGIIDEFKRQQRSKRCIKNYEVDKDGNRILDRNGKPKFTVVPEERLDAPVGKNGDYTLGDLTASDFDMDKEIFGEEELSQRMLEYLSRLSNLQKSVLELKVAGYRPREISEELHISQKQYADCEAAIHSYRNVSALF